jgi:hypothetical protein
MAHTHCSAQVHASRVVLELMQLVGRTLLSACQVLQIQVGTGPRRSPGSVAGWWSQQDLQRWTQRRLGLRKRPGHRQERLGLRAGLAKPPAQRFDGGLGPLDVT